MDPSYPENSFVTLQFYNRLRVFRTPSGNSRDQILSSPPPSPALSKCMGMPSHPKPSSSKQLAAKKPAWFPFHLTSNSPKDKDSEEGFSITTLTPVIYPFKEISEAINAPESQRLSSSSWHSVLRNRCVKIFQLRICGDPLPVSRLSAIARSNHRNLVRLLGASPIGVHIYVVYERVGGGSSLKKYLKANPSCSLKMRWTSRMQIALDLAKGLEYIHHHCDTVHGRIKTSTVIVTTEPELAAKICLFGANDLAVIGEGTPSKESDVFAFGVLVLELISAGKAWGCDTDSIIESARDVIGREDEDGVADQRSSRVRAWVEEPLLLDAITVGMVEKLIRIALQCVDADANKRPDMATVAGKVCKVFLDLKDWEVVTLSGLAPGAEPGGSSLGTRPTWLE